MALWWSEETLDTVEEDLLDTLDSRVVVKRDMQ